MRATGAGERFTSSRVKYQVAQCGDPGIGIVGRKKDRRAAGCLAQRRQIRCDDRNTNRLGFESGNAETFVVGWKDKDIAFTQHAHDLLMRLNSFELQGRAVLAEF